jgi:hypothetical protein
MLPFQGKTGLRVRERGVKSAVREMRPSRHPAALVVLGLLATVVLASPGSFVKGQEDLRASLEEAVQSLKAWRSGFVNLRIAWELRSAKHTHTLGALNSSTELPLPPPFATEEWMWDETGIDYMVEQFPGETCTRTVQVWNLPENVAFKASHLTSAEGVERLVHLEFGGLGAGKPVSAVSKTPLRGLYFPWQVKWIDDLLDEQRDGVELAREQVQEWECLRVQLLVPHAAVVWLDPHHNYLVRRYKVGEEDGSGHGSDTIVEEFQLTEEGLEVPSSGTFRHFSEPDAPQRWTVTAAESDGTPDPALLRPPRPEPSTIVTDNLTGTTYTAIDPTKRRQIEDEAARLARANLPSLATTEPGNGTWILVIAALAAFSLILLVAFRRRGPRTTGSD